MPWVIFREGVFGEHSLPRRVIWPYHLASLPPEFERTASRRDVPSPGLQSQARRAAEVLLRHFNRIVFFCPPSVFWVSDHHPRPGAYSDAIGVDLGGKSVAETVEKRLIPASASAKLHILRTILSVGKTLV